MKSTEQRLIEAEELLNDVANSYEETGCEGCGTISADVIDHVRAWLGMALLNDGNDDTCLDSEDSLDEDGCP